MYLINLDAQQVAYSSDDGRVAENSHQLRYIGLLLYIRDPNRTGLESNIRNSNPV